MCGIFSLEVHCYCGKDSFHSILALQCLGQKLEESKWLDKRMTYWVRESEGVIETKILTSATDNRNLSTGK